MGVYNYRYLYETKGDKPIDFDLGKNLDEYEKETIKNKLNTSKYRNTKVDMKNYGTTTIGKDLIDAEIQTHVELFDKESALFITNSTDIVKAYNDMIDLNIDTILNNLNTNTANYGSIEWLARQISDVMISTGWSESEVRSYLKGTFFQELHKSSQIDQLIYLRTSYCDNMVKDLSQMIKQNYEIIGFTESEFNSIYEELNSDSNNISGSMKALRDKLSTNIKNIMSFNNSCIDTTKIGLKAKIFIPSQNSKQVLNISTFLNNNVLDTTSSTAIDVLLQKATFYDCIIFCHGNVTKFDLGNNYTDFSLRTLNYTRNFYKLCLKNGKDFDYARNAIDNDTWGIDGTISINGGPNQSVMNFTVADAIVAGYKNILICSCNPGEYDLDDVLLNQPGVTITYSNLDNLTEEYEYNDILTSLNESENQLKKICNEFSINYDKVLDDFDNSYTYFDEGNVYMLIKEVTKRAVAFIVSIFKQIVKFVKNIYNSLKEKIKTVQDKYRKLKEPLKVPMIALDKEARVDIFDIYSIKDLERISDKIIKSMQIEINKQQNMQVTCIRKMQEYVNKLTPDVIEEDLDISVTI